MRAVEACLADMLMAFDMASENHQEYEYNGHRNKDL